MVLGLLRRDGAPLTDADRTAVYGAVSGDRFSHESTYAVLIANEATVHRTPAGTAFIFKGRIFNRSELIDILRPVEGRCISNADLAGLAYGRFGKAAPQRLVETTAAARSQERATANSRPPSISLFGLRLGRRCGLGRGKREGDHRVT